MKGRLSKIPYSLSGYRAKSTDRQCFCDFNSAIRVAGKYSGIGLGIFDGYCAVDIDHCVVGGRLNDLALDVINAMNSYTEYSPSGEGVRIIFKADGFTYDKQQYYINNHQCLINGKFEGITIDDFLKVGIDSGLNKRKMDVIIKEVKSAVRNWPTFAAQAEIPDNKALEDYANFVLLD